MHFLKLCKRSRSSLFRLEFAAIITNAVIVLSCSEPGQLLPAQWSSINATTRPCAQASESGDKESLLHRQSAHAAGVFATTSALEDAMAVVTCRADASINEHESCTHAVAQAVEGNSSRKVQGKNSEEEDDGCCLCWCRPKEAGILHGTRYRMCTKHQMLALFSCFHCYVC